MHDDNSSMSRIAWWILGGLAGLILFITSFVIGKIDGLDREIGMVQSHVSALAVRVAHIDELIVVIHRDQAERAVKLSDVNVRLVVLELKLKQVEYAMGPKPPTTMQGPGEY